MCLLMYQQFVFPFDYQHPGSPRDLSSLLGGKGANLAEMTSVLNLPVPPGFTISTEACREALKGAWPDGLREEIRIELYVAGATGGPEARRSKRSAVGQRAVRCKFIDAGNA